MNGFCAFLTSSEWVLGLGLFQKMCHNLLIYTDNFCFGDLALSCFFETFLVGWLGGRAASWLENLILRKTQLSAWTWTLDFALGFVNKMKIHSWVDGWVGQK